MIDWSDKQKSFFANSYHSFNIMSGAVSSGKTYISNLRWYKHILEAPKNSLLVMIGKTGESLRDNCIRYLMEMDGSFSLDETKVPMRLYSHHNTVEVACCGGDNERSWQRIQGKTTAGAYFDEITNLPQTLVQNICKGCRHQGKVWPKFMTCNPDHPSHFIKQLYIDSDNLDKRVWYFGLQDNPSLTDEYIKEVKQLYTGAMYERMIEGKWVQAEGIVYNEFDRDKHLFKTVKNTIKDHVIGIDWGYTNPLAIILMAVDYDGNYYELDEIYHRQQHIDESLKAVMKAKGWLDMKPRVSYGYADTNRPDCIQSMHKLLGFPILGAIKDVEDGIQCVNGMLKKGKLLTHDTKCPNLLIEKESYCWKDKAKKDEPVKDNDHLVDAERYVIYTRERGRVRMIQGNPFKR